MKIKYITTRETAAVIKEMAGNCGSALEGLGSMASFANALRASREMSVESFMTGERDVPEPTAEAVLKSFQNCRTFRAKTITKLAPTITVIEDKMPLK